MKGVLATRPRGRPAPGIALALLAAITFVLAGSPPISAARGGQLAAAGETAYPEGIDVSHWNGAPLWKQVIADGVGFVIAKATEGQAGIDSQYARNKAKAAELGLPFTAYHFARPDRSRGDARLEADHFVDVAGLASGHLLPVLDLEDHGTLGPRRLRIWVKRWLAEVEARIGVKPIIYTSPAFWKDRMGNSRWFADNGYRLWIAHWGVTSPKIPARNWAGHGWTLWQYDNCGSVAGISGCVDLDRSVMSDLSPLLIGNNR
jgi:GH25 family lysozyme M1 (1,4-beta-N-acetylmuramidase)